MVSYINTFTCQHNLDAFQHSTTVFIDDTFKSIPQLFCQIFTVFITEGNFYIPVISLLQNRTTKTYQIVMDQIVPYETNVTTIFADFETIYTY